MDVLFIDRAALALGSLKNLQQRRVPGCARLGHQGLERIVKGGLGFRIGAQTVQFLGKTHDLRNGADFVTLAASRITAAVPTLHVLLAALAHHQPRDVFCGIFAEAALHLLLVAAPLLQRSHQQAAVCGILAVNRQLFFREVLLHLLVLHRHQCLAQLVVNAAFIGQVREFTLDALRAFLIVRTEIGRAALYKQHLCIGCYTDRLLPRLGAQTMKRVIPIVKFSAFEFFCHSCITSKPCRTKGHIYVISSSIS